MAKKDQVKVEDSYIAEIKGPDPEVWGEDGDRPTDSSGPEAGLSIGEIKDEGTEDEVKGPGEEWRTYHEENNSE